MFRLPVPRRWCFGCQVLMLFLGSKVLLSEGLQSFVIFPVRWSEPKHLFCLKMKHGHPPYICFSVVSQTKQDELFLTSSYWPLFELIMLPHFLYIVDILFPISFICYIFTLLFMCWLWKSNNVSVVWNLFSLFFYKLLMFLCLLQTLSLVSATRFSVL